MRFRATTSRPSRTACSSWLRSVATSAGSALSGISFLSAAMRALCERARRIGVSGTAFSEWWSGSDESLVDELGSDESLVDEHVSLGGDDVGLSGAADDSGPAFGVEVAAHELDGEAAVDAGDRVPEAAVVGHL